MYGAIHCIRTLEEAQLIFAYPNVNVNLVSLVRKFNDSIDFTLFYFMNRMEVLYFIQSSPLHQNYWYLFLMILVWMRIFSIRFSFSKHRFRAS